MGHSMTIIFSKDGQTVTRRFRTAPAEHWEQTSETGGRYVPADTSTGYFPLVEVDRPADTEAITHDYSIVRSGDTFAETWTQVAKTAEQIKAEREAQYPTAEESAKIAARLIVLPKIAADELDDDQLAALTGLFPSWDEGSTVNAGEVYRWDGTLVEVVQPHTTQADWTPDTVPALFKVHRTAGSVSPWVQPTGAHDTYGLGDRVTHNGQTWVSTNAANSWKPGVFGWTRA